jgi:DNA-binding CsgD family transcriptional regulator
MKMAAASPIEVPRLRVFMCAFDGPRRVELERFLAAAGYELAAGPADADVVLAEGEHPFSEDRTGLTVGSTVADHAGALESNATPEQIDAAIRAVAAGLVVRSKSAKDSGFAAMKEKVSSPLLTPREVEVLGAMGEGQTNKMIARRLDISLHTVKFHVESVLRKLGARTRAEAVAKALERRRRETIEL